MYGELEVVEFRKPARKNTLCINDFPPIDSDPVDVRDFLHATFSRYGLLHGIITPDLVPGQAACNMYGLVLFYCQRDSLRAKQETCAHLFWKGRLLRVSHAKQQIVQEERPPLYITKCYELASHYLGFNGWTTKVLEMTQDVMCMPLSAKFSCKVELHILNHGVCVTGSSEANVVFNECEKNTKSIAMCRSRKRAYERAMEDAFSSVVLVIMPNDKVYVDINSRLQATDAEDAMQGMQPVLQINELDGAPTLTSDEEENTDIGDEVDQLNVRLLQELSADT